jgi:signal transduction histidine kinase
MAPHAGRDAELAALFQRGLGERLRRQDRVHLHATALLAQAGSDPRWQQRGRVLQAWGEIYLGQVDAGEATALRALDAMQALGDASGAAAARDILSGCQMLRGDYAGAAATLQPAVALPRAARSALERAISIGRMAVVNERWGKLDEALRWHYLSIAAARDAGDAAYEATALGATGGLQLSLQNLDDAATLCERAWQIVQREGSDWTNTWSLVAMNWLMVLHFQQRHDEALPLVDAIDAAEARLPRSMAFKRKLLLAMALAAMGQTARAQTLLDDGLALSRQDTTPPIEWVWTQARLWNRAGRHGEALRVCEAHHRARAEGRLAESDLPSDVVGLNTEMALAHEALGQYVAALAAQRALTAAERELVGVATRARRLTLQIQFELETSEREQTRLAQLNEVLREADGAKSRFLAAASHDLRQPIHALGLQLAHLRACVVDGEAVAIAQRMERAVGALNAMFDTLLDISRMDAGVVAPRRQSLALRPFMARLAEEFAPLAQAKGLRLALRVGTPGRSHTDSDPALLESLVRNLLSNAIKYTRQGGVLFALRPHGGAWRLEVWDSGPGIAPEEQERVFEEFYQVGNPSRDRAGGMGLGLAIARRLARLLDHPLRLDSRPGRGTRFTVALARVEPGVEVAAAPPPPLSAASLAVAVIEDDLEVRESLAALLQRWGHEVFAAASADEWLRQHAAAPRAIDAVIADYRLRGEQRGDAQVRQLFAALGAATPTLIVTGDTAPERIQALSECGFAWLSKPVKPTRLRSWLGSLTRAAVA